MATPCCKIEPKQHDCELNYCKPGSHRIEIENYGIVYGIVYCPLHQAAPQLWASLEKAVSMISQEYCSHNSKCSPTAEGCYVRDQLAALTAAQGTP